MSDIPKGPQSEEDIANWFASHGGKQRCPSCGAPAAGIIRSLAQESELLKKHPRMSAALILGRQMADPGAPAQLPTFETKYGKLVVIATVTPCRGCFPAAEKAAAKHPSWIIVEIEAPHVKRIISSVPLKVAGKRNHRGMGDTAAARVAADVASATKH